MTKTVWHFEFRLLRFHWYLGIVIWYSRLICNHIVLRLGPPKVRIEKNAPYQDLTRRILCLVDKTNNLQHFIQVFRSENIADIAQGAAEYTGNAFNLDHKGTITR